MQVKTLYFEKRGSTGNHQAEGSNMKKYKEDILTVFIFFILICGLAYGAKLQRTQLWPSTGRLQPSDQITDFHVKQQFAQVKEWADKLQEMLDTTFRKVANIPFNQSEALTVADTGSANAEFSVTHHLDRVPNGYIITKNDAACSVYDSGTTWTSTTIYLKCDTANVALSLSVF